MYGDLLHNVSFTFSACSMGTPDIDVVVIMDESGSERASIFQILRMLLKYAKTKKTFTMICICIFFSL